MKYVFACVVALLVIAPVAAAGGHHKAPPPKHEYPKPPSNNPAPPPVVVPPPPPSHVCIPQNPDGSLGGKDGKPGNDDCARDVVPPPSSPPVVTPSSAPSVLVPPVPPTVITKTVTVVKLVPAKPKPPRVIIRWRTRFVVCPKNHVANKLRNACVPTGKQVTG